MDDLLTLASSETDDIASRSPVDLGRDGGGGGCAKRTCSDAARGMAIDAAWRARLVVDGDPQRMKQVLMIVLDNAVKYSRREGVVMLAVEEQAGEAVVTVRNRSEHVDAGELPRVFDRFYRGRDAAAAGSAGSGLGLSIARWMTEKQGGSIALVRSEADWIEVCLRFPLAQATAKPAARPASRALADTPA